jgi:hypothetical protein
MTSEEFNQQIHHILQVESPNRSREDKDLSKWGWEREITEHGIVYKGWEGKVDEEFLKRLGVS